MSRMQDVLVGYFTWIHSAAREMTVAGLLVTNRYGVPIEFRYTDPVRATPEQKILYGPQKLDEAIVLTAAASLWKAIQMKPGLLLVEDPSANRLWTTLGTRSKLSVAWLEALPTPTAAVDGAIVVPLDASGKRLGQVRACDEDAQKTEQAAETLRQLAKSMQVDEPFERVERLLRVLHQLSADDRRARASLSIRSPEPDPVETSPEPMLRPARSPEEGRSLMAQFVRAKKSRPSVAPTSSEDPYPTHAETTSRFPSVEEQRKALRRALAQRRERPEPMRWWESPAVRRGSRTPSQGAE